MLLFTDGPHEKLGLTWYLVTDAASGEATLVCQIWSLVDHTRGRFIHWTRDLVPNPLFDIAGMLCGQFNIPFWKFFLATLIGKAVVKVSFQTTSVITLCNNQLFDLVEKRLIWAFGNVPGVASVLLSFVGKLKTAKDKFLSAQVAASASSAGKGKWNLSFTLIWNTLVWLMVVNFIIQIVTSTAQGYLRTQQELEMSTKLSETELSASEPSSD
nr:unnamed protein product [Digitaria exilis]